VLVRVVFIVAVLSARAAESFEAWEMDNAPAVLEVQLFNYAGVPDAVMKRAEARLQYTLSKAGIRLLLSDCTVGGGTNAPACELHAGTAMANVRIFPGRRRTQRGVNLDDLGVAFLLDEQGAYASVFYESVSDFARGFSLDPAAILAHVVAHEIGHMFLGSAHTLMGVMQAGVSGRQVEWINRRWVLFSRDQAAQLCANIRQRRQ